jgi:integrase
MGLEVRTGRGGELRKHWYGSYVDGNGKRRVVSLSEPLPARHYPGSLTETGDTVFEASRARAQMELETFQTEARRKGRADDLTAKLIEAKTGQTAEIVRLADLAARWRGIDRDGGAPSEKYLAWCDSVFKRFAAAVKKETLIEVTQADVKQFVDGVRATHADKTVSDMRMILRAAFLRLLPIGAADPFNKTVRRRRARNAIKGGMIARRPLIGEELQKVLETARRDPDPMLYRLTAAAAFTGLRIGDVCLLRWQAVDLRGGWLNVVAHKTAQALEIPIAQELRQVLEECLTERAGSEFVFPAAAAAYRRNPTEIYYKGKVLFARALIGGAENEREQACTASEPVDLAEVLPEVSEAVRGAGFADSKRDRILDSLARVARGDSYRKIETETGRHRAQVSEDLHDAELASGQRLRRGTPTKSGRDIKTLVRGTRQARTVGRRAACLLGWHNLRGTFIVYALNAGLSFETVGKITGHTTARVIRNHYFNPQRGHTAAAVAAFQKEIGGGAGTVADLAAQLKTLSAADRAALQKLLKEGEQ